MLKLIVAVCLIDVGLNWGEVVDVTKVLSNDGPAFSNLKNDFFTIAHKLSELNNSNQRQTVKLLMPNFESIYSISLIISQRIMSFLTAINNVNHQEYVSSSDALIRIPHSRLIDVRNQLTTLSQLIGEILTIGELQSLIETTNLVKTLETLSPQLKITIAKKFLKLQQVSQKLAGDLDTLQQNFQILSSASTSKILLNYDLNATIPVIEGCAQGFGQMVKCINSGTSQSTSTETQGSFSYQRNTLFLGINEVAECLSKIFYQMGNVLSEGEYQINHLV